MKQVASWSAAIFAHDEARSIVSCLDSVLSQDGASNARVFVLDNGSRDATGRLVRDYAAAHPGVRLESLALADKANAWNHYVHVLRPQADVHFFVDGDVSVLPGAFADLAGALQHNPLARAAAAMPATGRDRAGWSARMVALGRLAGGLYALQGAYVAELATAGRRMPVGLIGEDLLLSCLVKDRLDPVGLLRPSPRLVHVPRARFAFESLSPRRPHDWLQYARRMVRYRVREHQLTLLFEHLGRSPEKVLPADVETLYREADELPRYVWRGRMTPFDLLAVHRIRRGARARTPGQPEATMAQTGNDTANRRDSSPE